MCHKTEGTTGQKWESTPPAHYLRGQRQGQVKEVADNMSISPCSPAGDPGAALRLLQGAQQAQHLTGLS